MSRIPVPSDLTKLARDIAQMKRDIAQIRGQRRLRSAVVSEGALTIKPPGELILVDRVTGTSYRLVVDSGVLSVEAV